MNVPAEELLVSEVAGGSMITVNGTVENAILNGDNSTIGGRGKLDKVQDNGNNQVEVEVGEEILTNSIVFVEVRGMSRMIVTLEKATTQPLAVEDMRIICHGGKEMTLLSAKTEDNRVYEVSTSVFAKDDTYTFSMEIAPGKIISKYFSYKVDCPTVSDATVLRSEATRAESVSYTHLDVYKRQEEGDEFAYILQRVNNNVFKDPAGVMENIFGVTEYLRNVIREEGGDPDLSLIHILHMKHFCSLDFSVHPIRGLCGAMKKEILF